MSVKTKSKSEKLEKIIAEKEISANAEVESIQRNNTEIKIRINSQTKELSVNSTLTKIISKKRLMFDCNGNKVPIGSRYVMIVNPRERKLIFEVDEIDELILMIEKSIASKVFSFVMNDESIVLIYKAKNEMRINTDELDFIVLALTEMKVVLSKIDNIQG